MSEPRDAELDFVDEVATFFAQEGMPMIAGRVIGWLLVSDPPEQSAADLAGVLEVSRSSISSSMKLLTPSGLVESVRKRGERQEYFRITPHGWSQMLANRYAKTTTFRQVIDRGLDMLDALEESTHTRRQRLENVADLYTFLEAELPAMWQRWERQRASAEG